MWSLSNDYGLNTTGGERPLGDYTEKQRQLKLFYELAAQLQKDGQIFAQIDLPEEVFKLGEGTDEHAALLYGLKPYMVMQPLGTPTPLIKPQVAQLGGSMQPQFLKSLLHKIVEES